MTDQPPQLKDPFAIEGDDAFDRDRARKSTSDHAESAESGSIGQQAPVLRDPFKREQTPVPELTPTTERSAKKRGDSAASTTFTSPTASHAVQTAAKSAAKSATKSATKSAEKTVVMTQLSSTVSAADMTSLSGRELTMPGVNVTAFSTSEPASDSGHEAHRQIMPQTSRAGRFPGTAATQSDVVSDSLTGREMTMPGLASAPLGDLTGREMTMPGLTSAPLGDLTGREMTMPGLASAPLGDLTGREMTMPGLTPPPEHASSSEPTRSDFTGGAERTPRTMASFVEAAAQRERATPTPGRSRTGFRSDTASNDDAWHYQGRVGPFTGQLWGDWDIGGILGEGGMGTVYRAKQRSLNRRVALKVLAPNLAADLKLLQRFQLEARTASLLTSPNVVQVFAAGEWEENHFFVMEYVEGRDLYDVMKARAADGKPFTPDESADIIIQAAKGLAEAGRIGVVHRDIKPPNLMVTTDNLVKIADFGIVKVMGESALTMAGQAVGTPSYVSPEQGRGESDVDQRSDLYSLGIVYYELLTGKKPFEGSTPNAIIYQHCFGEPTLPREVNPLIDEKYQAVCLKCLQKKPENRYQNAGELIRDLEDIRSGRMLASALANYRQGTGADEAKRENMTWAQRHLLALVASLVVFVMVAGVGGYQVFIHQQEKFKEAENFRLQAQSLDLLLSDLEKPKSIPDGAEERVKEYAQLPSASIDLKKLERWQTKLKRVADLRGKLKALDAAEIPLALRRSATADLRTYQELVGTGDALMVSWKERLDDLAIRERDMRQRLREVDQQANLTQVIVDGVTPLVRQLGVMAGNDDAFVTRITTRLTEFSARRDKLVTNLSALDQKDAVITEAKRPGLQANLAELTLIIGTQDERIARWSGMLASNAERIGQLRQRLRRLDAIDLPPLAMQLELEKDFAALKELVEENDPELRGWKSKIAATTAEIESLRKRLARLDKTDLLAVADVQPMTTWLADLVKLVGGGDEQALSWDKKLRAVITRHEGLRTSLARLDRVEALTLEEFKRLSADYETFVGVGGLSEEQKTTYPQRLSDDHAQTLARAERLQQMDRVTPMTAELRQDLTIYTTQAGIEQVDVKRWNEKRERIDRLLVRLVPLDTAASVADDASQAIDALVGEIGADHNDVRRWRSKLTSVQKTVAALAALDRSEPLPNGVHGDLTELARLVGENDPHYRQWRGKVERVAALKNNLQRAVVACGHSPTAHAAMHADFRELVDLVSLRDLQAAAWAPRMIELDGPGQPSWASAAGRDDFGWWADWEIGSAPVQRFRFVPSGVFIMGSSPSEAGHKNDEVQVNVTITKAFWLADTECPQAMWQAVMANNPSRHHSADRPVERISWRDAQTFVSKVHGLRSMPVRLPTEAEWEYAARAGGTNFFTPARQDGIGIEQVAWFDVNSGSTSKAVKLRFPNPIGLYDLHGNVWEWCQDRYAPYTTVPVSDPLGRDGENNVARGGSWGDPVTSVRAAHRVSLKSDLRSAYVGVRLACDVEWPSNVPASAPPNAVNSAPLSNSSNESSLVPTLAPIALPAVTAEAPTPAEASTPSADSSAPAANP